MQNLQIQKDKSEQFSKLGQKQQFIFLIHGIASLFGWFVVLNSLDYFQSIYLHYDVYAFFLLSILIGYIIIAVSYRKITQKISIQKVINLGLIVCTVSLLLLLLTSLIFKKTYKFGFYLSIILCVIVGISSNIVQLSYFAMINFVPEKVISTFTLGTAFSGLSLTILRMIITAITGTKPLFGPIFIYFLIASIVQIFDLFLNNHFCRSQFFIEKLSPFMNRSNQSRKVLNMDQSQQPTQLPKQGNSFLKQLLAINKKIYPYPLIIFLNYLMNMMLFPDLTIKIRFNFSQVWSSLTFIFLFGLGDTVGKFLGSLKGTFNKKSNLYLIGSKIGFFLIIPVLASGSVKDDPLVSNVVFPFIVIFLFGLTTGFTLCSSIILVSQKCEPADKQLSGVLCGISLQFGLMAGTILAIPMQLIASKQTSF